MGMTWVFAQPDKAGRPTAARPGTAHRQRAPPARLTGGRDTIATTGHVGGRIAGAVRLTCGGTRRHGADATAGQPGRNGMKRYPNIRASISECRLITLGSWVRIPPLPFSWPRNGVPGLRVRHDSPALSFA